MNVVTEFELEHGKVQQIESLDVLLVNDCHSTESINNIIKKFGRPSFVFGNTATTWFFDLDVPRCTLPAYLGYLSKKYSIDDCEQTVETTHCFNFIINKKKLHRYLTLRLVEFHQLNSYQYTYSGVGNNVVDDRIFQDLEECDPNGLIFDKHTMSLILGDVTIPKKFQVDPDIQQPTDSSMMAYGGMQSAWKNYLKPIFSNTFISLITESDNDDYDKSAIFSEKSMYSVLGLTVPIWVGMYAAADEWEKMGLDSFKDIVDHSYQYESTMFMRCIKAFQDNLHLLNDINLARDLRKQLMPRLERNRNLIFSGVIDRYIDIEIESLPTELKSIANAIKNKVVFERFDVDL